MGRVWKCNNYFWVREARTGTGSFSGGFSGDGSLRGFRTVITSLKNITSVAPYGFEGRAPMAPWVEGELTVAPWRGAGQRRILFVGQGDGGSFWGGYSNNNFFLGWAE